MAPDMTATYPGTYLFDINSLGMPWRRWPLSATSLDIGKIIRNDLSESSTKLAESKDSLILITIDGRPLLIKSNKEARTLEVDGADNSHASAIAKQLDGIKDRLALSVTQIAELFGVTRKAVYDWYEGAEPRASTVSRMEVLMEVLDQVPQEVAIQRLKTVWNINAAGQSFRALLCDDRLDRVALRSALTAKLNELYPLMVATTVAARRKSSYIGEAHLSEFDRRSDFG